MYVPVTLLVLAGSVALAAAQKPAPRPPVDDVPKARSGVRPQEVAVTLRGCIRGRLLYLTRGSINDVQTGLLNATQFVLEGPRDLMQLLAKDHEGHEEEVTGVAIIPESPANSTVATKTAKRGKATAVVGVRESGGGTAGRSSVVGDTNLPVRLKVQTSTHIEERCTIAP